MELELLDIQDPTRNGVPDSNRIIPRRSLDGDSEGDNWGIKLSYIFSLDAPSFGG